MQEVVRLCPDCHSTMSPHIVESLRTDICDRCGGVWLDTGEFPRVARPETGLLDDIVDAEPPILTPVVGNTQGRVCPVDGGVLTPNNYCGASDIVLGNCPTCNGIFVSHDDLLRLHERAKQYAAGPTLDPSVPSLNPTPTSSSSIYGRPLGSTYDPTLSSGGTFYSGSMTGGGGFGYGPYGSSRAGMTADIIGGILMDLFLPRWWW